MRSRITSVLLASIFIFTASIRCSVAASELNSVAHFNIPAGPLPNALLQFSAQSGVQVTSAADLVAQKRSNGVSGEFPAGQALTLLLMGTQLSFDPVDTHTVSIRRDAHSGGTNSPAGTQAPSVRSASISGAGSPPTGGGQTSAAAAEGKQEGVIEEIVVTARRREERAQSVPASITAYSAEDVKTHNITDQLSLANSTPSMASISSGQPPETGGFAIRGQGPAFGATPGTIGYFSDVPNGLLTFDGRPGTYYDLASVQILKGPQGTLFGKNATGGNVLFEPQRPTDQFGGYVQVQAGDYNDHEFEGALNLPIFEDKVMFRVSGAYARRDGYTRDVGPLYPGKEYDNLGYESFRAELLLRPVDALENYTIYRYYHSSDNGPGTSLIAFNPNAGTPPLTVAAFFPNVPTYLSQQLARGPRDVAYNIDQYVTSNYDQLINTTSYTVSDSFKIKNIISYSKAEFSYGYDYDATPAPIAGQTSPGTQTEAETYMTEELQLQGRAFGDGLQYVVGGFLDRQWPTEYSIGQFDYFPTSVLLGMPLPVEQYEGTKSRAGFGQLTYDLGKLVSAVEGLSVTAGYRYTHDELYQGSLILAPPFVTGTGSWNYGSYTFGVDYKITPTVLTYVTARSAFKAGGVNSELPAGSPFATFQPEKLKDVEVGLKADFHLNEMAVRTNIDVFRGDYTNIQRTTPVDAGGILVNLTNNAAKGLIEGVEWEGTLLPIPSVELSTLYAYTESKYTDVTSAQAALVLQGAPFPYISKNKGSFSARYRLPLPASVGDLGIMGIYTYQSPQSIAQTNQTVYPYMPGYSLVNARLDWRGVFRSSVDLSAFVTNLTNKTYPIGQFDAYDTFGFVTRTYGPPRMYGVQVKYSFGH
jgi:iron complex outermembrane recepter protein